MRPGQAEERAGSRGRTTDRPSVQDIRDRDLRVDESYTCESKPRGMSMLAFLAQNAIDYAELFMGFLASSTDDFRGAFARFQERSFGRALEAAPRGVLLAEIRRLQADPRYRNAQESFNDPAEYSRWLRAVREAGEQPKPDEWLEFIERVCRHAGFDVDGPQEIPHAQSRREWERRANTQKAAANARVSA